MKKKWLYLINIPSAIVLFLAFSKANVLLLASAVIIGLILGIAEFLYLNKTNPKINIVGTIIACLIGGWICFFIYTAFYQTRISSQNVMRKIVLSVFSEYSSGLRIISMIIAVCAWPAVSAFIGIVLHCLAQICKVIDYKTLWNTLIQDISLRSVLKRTGITIAQVLLAVLIGAGLLAGVYALPVNRIENNVKKSVYTMQSEGLYPTLFKWATSTLDNFTDSFMLMEAAAPPIDSVLVDAMNVPHGGIYEQNPVEGIVSHYVAGEAYDVIGPYARYWHGYLIFLKPLLLFFDYSQIRILNGVIQTALVGLICVLLYKKNFKLAIIPYLLSYSMLVPPALAKSFQYSSCFYIFTFGCLALLLLREDALKNKSVGIFLVCGIMTAFFDYLTYPISTFGIPMLFCLLLMKTEPAESKICVMIRNGLFWCIGYAGMWISKWVLGSVITGNNIIANGISKVMERTSTVSDDGARQYSIFVCEIKNYLTFLKTPITFACLLMMAWFIVKVKKNKKSSAKEMIRILFPFLLTGCAPVVWYAFATNHSMIHSWFTNKACAVSVLAVLFGLACLLQHSKDSV